MPETDIPRAPNGFEVRGKALWKELHQQFDFTADPHKSALIEDACRTTDVIDHLQKVVDGAEDLRVRGSQGQPVGMPELAELRPFLQSGVAGLQTYFDELTAWIDSQTGDEAPDRPGETQGQLLPTDVLTALGSMWLGATAKCCNGFGPGCRRDGYLGQ